jgi:hypothetical protein
MTCDLTDMEIQILYILYRNKNFKSNAGYHSEKLKKNSPEEIRPGLR